jgi:hypothetical protein
LDPSGEGHGLAGVREAEFATGVGAVHGAWEMACEGTERGIVGWGKKGREWRKG